MTVVSVVQRFAGTVHEAERCWYDTGGWSRWLDGLARVVEVSGDWPRSGSRVIWDSGPAGRGRVIEQVSEYEPLVGQAVAVEDDSITATQRVTFDAVPEGVQVALSLEYAIKRRSPLTPLVDVLFVRRAMAASLAKTLGRFAVVLEERRRQQVG